MRHETRALLLALLLVAGCESDSIAPDYQVIPVLPEVSPVLPEVPPVLPEIIPVLPEVTPVPEDQLILPQEIVVYYTIEQQWRVVLTRPDPYLAVRAWVQWDYTNAHWYQVLVEGEPVEGNEFELYLAGHVDTIETVHIERDVKVRFIRNHENALSSSARWVLI